MIQLKIMINMKYISDIIKYLENLMLLQFFRIYLTGTFF